MRPCNETVIAQRTETKKLPDRHEINASARLVKYDGNQSPHFSVTGEILNLRRRGDNQFESGGCIHDDIVKHFPYLAPVIAVHLADDHGRPMHAVENALYWAGLSSRGQDEWRAIVPDDDYGRRTLETDEHGTWAPETLASHLRVSVDDARAIRDYCVNDETQHYSEAMRFCLRGLEPQWQREADAARAVLAAAKTPTFTSGPGVPYVTNRAPITVERISFTRSTPQIWHDSWRNADRTCRYRGDCISCGRRCYGFDDGQNDPRGVLGDNAVAMFYASDYDMTGPDVVACFLCQNIEDNYRRGLESARQRWTMEGES